MSIKQTYTLAEYVDQVFTHITIPVLMELGRYDEDVFQRLTNACYNDDIESIRCGLYFVNFCRRGVLPIKYKELLTA